jgi:hypothetical protein
MSTRALISASDEEITANETHKARTRLKPKRNARTGSLLTSQAIQARLRVRDIRERDIGERDMGERDIWERDVRETDIQESDIGVTVATRRFPE